MTERPSLPSLNLLSTERSLPPLSALLNSTTLPMDPLQRRSGSFNRSESTQMLPSLSSQNISVSRSAPVSPLNKKSELNSSASEPTKLQAAIRLPSISMTFENLHQTQQQKYQAPPQVAFPVLPVAPPQYQNHTAASLEVPELPGSHQAVTPVKPVGPQTRSPTSAEKRSYAFISHSPSTYPTHEPTIDDQQLARRKRRRTSPTELSILQSEFELGTTPNKTRRLEIAAKVNMTEKAVQIWFQNRRQTIRKQNISEKEVHHLEPIFMQHQHQVQLQQHLGQYTDIKSEMHSANRGESIEITSEDSLQRNTVPSSSASLHVLATPDKTPRQSNPNITPSSILKLRLQDQPKSNNKILTPISEKQIPRQNKTQAATFKIIQHPQSSPLENQENRSSPLRFRESAKKEKLNDSPTRIPLRELKFQINQQQQQQQQLSNENDKVPDVEGEGIANLLHLKNWR